MKNLLFVLFALFSNAMFSQGNIKKECDDMTDRCIYYPSSNIIIANSGKDKGFTIDARIVEENGSIKLSGILIKSVNIGSCNENDKLILMLSDSTKMTLTSWNKFNCEGNSWYNLKPLDSERLGTHKVIKAYFQNGRSYDSYTGEIPAEDQDYFVKIAADCKNNLYTPTK